MTILIILWISVTLIDIGVYISLRHRIFSLEVKVNTLSASTNSAEVYPANWKHCIIHLNPETGEMYSDGDHSVRLWILERIHAAQSEVRSKTTQQTKPVITPPTTGGKEYGTGG